LSSSAQINTALPPTLEATLAAVRKLKRKPHGQAVEAVRQELQGMKEDFSSEEVCIDFSELLLSPKFRNLLGHSSTFDSLCHEVVGLPAEAL
jgi:hypothetical protein